MSRHGDLELTRLNYVLWPDESIGPHTRVDIANEAASEIDSLRRKLSKAEDENSRLLELMTSKALPDSAVSLGYGRKDGES